MNILFLLLLFHSPSATLSCENDKDYRIIRTSGSPAKCSWIGKTVKRVKLWCGKANNGRDVDEACPKACGACSTNDPDYTFLVKGKTRDCEWIDNTTRRDKFCTMKKKDKYDTKKYREIGRYCRGSCQDKPKPPNIVVILADDVGVGDVKGYWDDGLVAMPNIQKFVDKGTIFRNAHSTPLCAPSRYVLLSGNYQHRGRNIGGTWKLEDENNFKTKQTSIAEVLKTKANYHTAAYGKWHLGAKIRPNGLQGDNDQVLSNPDHDFEKPVQFGASYLGFDESFITFSGHQGPPYAFFRNDLLQIDSIKFWEEGEYKMPKGNSTIDRAGEGSSSWDSSAYNMILVNEFQSFVDGHVESASNDPFFVYVALGGVHTPHTPPTTYFDGEPIAGQYPSKHMDMLLETDMNVGSIVQKLEENGLMNETIVVFTSDNGGLGPMYSEEFGHYSNRPLRGHKGQVYEGGHRVPLMMRYDGVIPEGEKEDSLIGLNDLYATFCDIADVDIPSKSALDSMSFADLVIPSLSKRKRREYIGIWKVLNGIITEKAILSSDNMKVIQNVNNETVQLYNLETDMSETDNISSNPNYEKLIEGLLQNLRKIGPK